MNPAFFNQHQAPNQLNDPYRVPPGPSQYGDYMGPMGDSSIVPPMAEAEFEEIMAKNRSVSSGAISRAVADASAGESIFLSIIRCSFEIISRLILSFNTFL